MPDISNADVYNIIVMLLDAFSAIIFIIILLTMFGIPVYQDQKMKSIFLACVIFGIVSAVVNITYKVSWHITNENTLYIALGYINIIVYELFSIHKTLFVLHFVDNGRKINKVLINIVMIICCVLLVALAIPSVSQKIYYVPDNQIVFMEGPWNQAYAGILSTVSLVAVAIIIINRNTLTKKDRIVLIVLQVLPVFSFSFLWREQSTVLLFSAIFMLVAYIIVYQGRSRQYMEREKELMQKQVQLSDMRTRVVLSQVQPHFMYNTLTTIAYFCKAEPDTAQKLTISFSSYLRANIDSLQSESNILFSKELEHTQNYLAIERTRFGNRLKVEYNIEFSNFTVPSLLLQPIAENAVKHGVCKKEEGGTVAISTHISDGYIVITVKDDGVGFDAEAVNNDGKTHIGLSNVRERLEKLCGGYMQVESRLGIGTTVKMYIPAEV